MFIRRSVLKYDNETWMLRSYDERSLESGTNAIFEATLWRDVEGQSEKLGN